MATLVLMFCVVLLVYEIVKRDQGRVENPFLRVEEQAGARAPDPPATTSEIPLFFAMADGTRIAPEYRRIEIGPSTVDNVRRALQALIDGPRELLAPLMPAATKVRGLYLLDDGELVVDFSRDLEAGHIKSASAELMMVHGIVASLTQPGLRGRDGPAVERVRFLFEGSPAQDTFPAHIDLTGAVYPDESWIAPPSEGPADA